MGTFCRKLITFDNRTLFGQSWILLERNGDFAHKLKLQQEFRILW